MRVSHVAFDPANLTTVINSAMNILRYNVLGLNGTRQARFSGNPYGNRGRLVLRLVERSAAEHFDQALRRRPGGDRRDGRRTRPTAT